MGYWVSTLLIIGIFLFVIDLLLSIFWCEKLEQTINDLDDEELKNAFKSDDWRNEILKVIQDKCDQQLAQMEEEKNYSNIYKNIREQLDEKMTFKEIVSLFKEVCCVFKTDEDYFLVQFKDEMYQDIEVLSLKISYRFSTIEEEKELSLEFVFDKDKFNDVEYFEFENCDEEKFFNKLFEEKFIKQVIEENVFSIKIYLYEDIV